MELMTDEKKGFKKTEVGLIPEDWEVYSLGELGDFKNGINKGKDSFGHGSPFVNLMDVFGVRSIADIKHLDLVDSNPSEKATYSLKKGDVLFVRSSVKPSGVGLTTLVDEDLNEAVYSGFLIRFRERGKIYHDYKAYCFHESSFRERLIAKSSVSANTNINQDSLQLLNIPLPPTLVEQQAIATALSDVDKLIRSLDRLFEKKEAIKKGAMQQLLTGKKRLPGFDGDWEVMTLGELFEKIVGGGTPRRSKNEYWNGDIPWATVKDFRTFRKNGTQESITKEGLLNSSSNLIPKGTVITSTRMGLGQAVIYDVDVAINQDLKAIFTNKKLLPNYLYYWFSANKEEIENLGSGSTVKGISLGDLKSFETLITDSLEEQKAIAQILSDMDGELQTLRQKREKMRRVKEGMMQELLTGKVRLV